MSAPVACFNAKKRNASEVGVAVCPLAKKVPKDAVALPVAAQMGGMPGVPGWQYPPLPMGMMPPMPYCMPGNPFFPFMGMFPPFWLPAAAMAAATMPALAAANAAGVGAATVPGMPNMAALQSSAAMWPMMACGAMAQPSISASMAIAASARTSSGVCSEVAIPSTSCTNSVPTVGLQSPASPSPLATSPTSVCNGPLTHEQQPADDEFATFIDSFLKADDCDFTEADLKALQAGAMMSCGGSNSSEDTLTDEPCLARSESHSLLSLLGEDLGL